MGRAIVQGIIGAGFTTSKSIAVGEPSAESRAWWTDNLPDVGVHAENRLVAEEADILIVAVKPKMVVPVVTDLKKIARRSLLVSVAAGVNLETLTKAFGGTRVVRVMPNTPCLVGQGASAFCCGDDVSDEDAQTVQSMLSAVGFAVRIDEAQIDAVTGLSGSGPAYICMIIEALADGGVLAGLPRDLAMQLATQTVLGTASLVKETGSHPAALKDAVASPGGTTIAAIASLEQSGLRDAMIGAVKAAAARSVEMGKN